MSAQDRSHALGREYVAVWRHHHWVVAERYYDGLAVDERKDSDVVTNLDCSGKGEAKQQCVQQCVESAICGSTSTLSYVPVYKHSALCYWILPMATIGS